MTQSKNMLHEEDPETTNPITKCPMAFFRGVSSFVPSLFLRRPITVIRLRAALANAYRCCRDLRHGQRFSFPDDQCLLIPPMLKTVKASYNSCPYDPDIYYSFPDLEEEHCYGLFCGPCSHSQRPSAIINFFGNCSGEL
jgi:hypothetical protein